MRIEPRQFKIEGLDCAEEVGLLKRELSSLVGGEDKLAFDLLNGKLIVNQSAQYATSAAIFEAIARTGLKARPWEDAHQSQPDSPFRLHARAILIGISACLTLVGFVTHAILVKSFVLALGSEGMGSSGQTPTPAVFSYALGIVAGTWFVLPRAALAIRRVQPDMNLLMVFAVLGAATLGDWFEASTVAFLFSVSLLLEKWSVAHARNAVQALLDLTPPKARLLSAGHVQTEISPEQVPVGSRLLVKPGERFPLDGRVISGKSLVNQAPITGESLPVAKSPGDAVLAATVNGEGALEIETTQRADSTIFARLIRMVGAAQSRRSASEQWVERFARIYTPAVLCLALFVFFLPPLLFGGGWYDWFYRALVLLVIACPCALVISTPVSIVAAIAAAARQGVLIKGGAFVEIPSRLRAMAFDKTGTLTEGKPVLVGVYPLNGHTESELLERIASLESHSEHPIGKAILAYAREHDVPIESAVDYQIIPGMGATARLHGKTYWLGAERLLEERGLNSTGVMSKLRDLSRDGVTIVIVGNEHHVCGYVTLADRVRPQALSAMKSLKKMGLERIVMLTGDNKPTAQVIAKAAGVEEVQADLLPAEKVSFIEGMVAQHGLVAMVGDGVNDAPAMARSSLGIAMGNIGSNVAVETADIALMSDDLSRLPWLIAHSRRTLKVIRANILIALTIKVAFVVLTFLGFASLWAAIAADMGASLVVIFNGLRLLRPTPISGHD